MTRRELWARLGGATLATGPRRRPNVILILTDDQRQDTVCALGNPAIRTPNLDRLVQSGVTFRNAYCMGGHVAAVCLPSRMMIMRGRSWFSILRDPRPTPNLPATLNAAGYLTYQFTKRGNTDHAAQQSFAYGDYPAPDDQADRLAAQPGRQMADGALRFLARWIEDPSRPFFMYLAGASPHDPRVAAPEYLAMYDPARIPLPRNFRPFHPFDNGDLFVRDERLAPWPRTEAEIRRHLRDYYAVITQMDREIGRIVEAVKQAGQYDHTIFLFTSDQGLALGSHGLMGKQNLYEHSMRPGLIVAGPGIPRGRQVDAFAYLLDIYPTICELVGLEPPASLEGKSLAPVIRGRARRVRDTVFLAYRDTQRAVRRGRWKLLRYPRINRTQLFDLAADPDEVNDLAGRPSHRARVDELTVLLRKQQELYGDSAPLVWEGAPPGDVTLEFYQKAPPPAPGKP